MERPGPRVLLVEDETIVALAARRALSSTGYSVDWAATGEEAVALFGEERGYEIVLMDLDLGPGIDGIETARSILGTRAVPLIFASAHDAGEVDARARGIEGYGFVRKGSGDADLLDAVARAIGIAGAGKRGAVSP